MLIITDVQEYIKIYIITQFSYWVMVMLEGDDGRGEVGRGVRVGGLM